MDEDQAKLYVKLIESLLTGLDDIFQLSYSKYMDRLSDDDIYQSFIVAMAQTLGRHVAAFPEEQRDQIALEALQIQEEMTALVITRTAEAELKKAHTKGPEAKYDLAKMTPEGNA